MAVERVAAPASGRVVLRITTRSSAVTVFAGDADDVEVEAGARTVVQASETDAGRTTEVEVTSRSEPITVRCPEGIDVILGLSSGHVRLDGRFGDVRVTSQSGHVEVDRVASLDVRTSSGQVRVGECVGDCRIMTRSGTVDVEAAGNLHASVKSGRISVDSVDRATVQAASGRIDLGATGRGDVAVRAMSGAVCIAVRGAARPQLETRTRSGSVHNECEQGGDFIIDVRTVSGAISVVPE